MEVNTKRGGWGWGQQDEGGRWVGRKKGDRWAWVGRSFSKINLGLGVGQKQIEIKLFPRKQLNYKKNLIGTKMNRRNKY
jgi:hypothetical protein